MINTIKRYTGYIMGSNSRDGKTISNNNRKDDPGDGSHRKNYTRVGCYRKGYTRVGYHRKGYTGVGHHRKGYAGEGYRRTVPGENPLPIVQILLAVVLIFTCIPSVAHAQDYSKYSNTKVEFGLNLRKDHKRPTCSKPKGVKKLSKYNTYYYGRDAYKNDEKVIYLTFDCGYENGNTKKILDTLKKEDVKAIFFVTEPYVKENAKLVKRMKEEGHLVGNHTCTHPQLTTLSVKKMKKEVNKCKKTMEKKTGYTMDPYMRPPEGVYSVRVMKVMQDCGYSTMLWSLAYKDYEEDNQPSVKYVKNMFKKHYFCGMMPLLHVISSADRKALPGIISFFKEKDYRFGTVDEFAAPEEKE